MTSTQDISHPPGGRFRAFWDKSLAAAVASVAENPDRVSAHVEVADLCITLWCFGFEPREAVLPRARESLTHALRIDPENAPANTTLGVLRLADWDWHSAEQAFEHALALDPDSPGARHWHALYLAAMGRHELALAESRRAVSLDPSPGRKVGLGAVLYFAHRFDEMARVMEETVATAPDSAPAHDWLGMAYVQIRRFDESVEVYRRAVDLADGTAEIAAGLGHAYGLAGRTAEAKEILAYLVAASERWYVPPVQIAYVHAGLGHTDAVFQMLEKAMHQRSWELVFVREEPWFDHLHSDARFMRVLESMSFPKSEPDK